MKVASVSQVIVECCSRRFTIADHVAVAHPRQLRLIFRSQRKNDRVDAEKLAKLLYLGEVSIVHVPEANVRARRELSHIPINGMARSSTPSA